MKIFAYALRDFDEQKYFIRFCEQNGIEYGYTPDYPSMENTGLAAGYEGISIITNPMYPEILDAYYREGVRYIATRSIGYDHIDIAYAHKIGMRITNVSYSPDSVSNYTIMLMLMACRKMPFIMAKAKVQDFSLKGKTGIELCDATVGVIGTGRIGRRVVQHLSGFGCRILAYDLYENEEVRRYAAYTDLDTIYREADIITLHVPGLPENTHMIDETAIGKMKDGVILINAARGLLIDTEAMIAGLESGKIGFAALDTIEHEAGLYYLNRELDILDSHHHDRAILSAFPNVIVSPHMAFYTESAVRDMVENSLRGLLACHEGGENPFEVK